METYYAVYEDHDGTQSGSLIERVETLEEALALLAERKPLGTTVHLTTESEEGEPYHWEEETVAHYAPTYPCHHCGAETVIKNLQQEFLGQPWLCKPCYRGTVNGPACAREADRLRNALTAIQLTLGEKWTTMRKLEEIRAAVEYGLVPQEVEE